MRRLPRTNYYGPELKVKRRQTSRKQLVSTWKKIRWIGRKHPRRWMLYRGNREGDWINHVYYRENYYTLWVLFSVVSRRAHRVDIEGTYQHKTGLNRKYVLLWKQGRHRQQQRALQAPVARRS